MKNWSPQRKPCPWATLSATDPLDRNWACAARSQCPTAQGIPWPRSSSILHYFLWLNLLSNLFLSDQHVYYIIQDVPCFIIWGTDQCSYNWGTLPTSVAASSVANSLAGPCGVTELQLACIGSKGMKPRFAANRGTELFQRGPKSWKSITLWTGCKFLQSVKGSINIQVRLISVVTMH